jgi:hypothetical protein
MTLSVGLLLAGGGTPELGERLEPFAALLAEHLDLPLRRITPPEAGQPARCLAALAREPRWLALLPLDPGQPLEAGGHWAEALGAWRQPPLLVFGADQVSGGWPAAANALMGQWRVPLLGLLQAGGPWDAAARRRDGLPWLGRVDLEKGWEPAALGQEGLGSLAWLLQQRRIRLDQGEALPIP